MTSLSLFALMTLVIGLYMAWTIGANDLSNVLGTSVGSKALTLKQAIILATILEFFGALFLGTHVGETIEGGIVSFSHYVAEPKIYIFGMMAALLATAFWMHIASFMQLPVSTTHSLVGAVTGFGLVSGSGQFLQWTTLGKISLSWVCAPLLSSLFAFFLFSILQKKILFHSHPLLATRKFLPLIAFFTLGFFVFNLLFGGVKTFQWSFTTQEIFLIALFFGFLGYVASFFLIKAILGKRIELRIKKMERGEKETSFEFGKIEKIFGYFQVFSASVIAFSHGANDVANAIGPVAGVFHILNSSQLEKTYTIPIWLLVIGGFGIIVGLATWGYKVVDTIGHKITTLSPSRGFCAEFAAAIVILLASKMGLPISTTHALVGAILGVAFARGLGAINLKIIRSIFLTWLVTIPACTLLCILIFFVLKYFF